MEAQGFSVVNTVKQVPKFNPADPASSYADAEANTFTKPRTGYQPLLHERCFQADANAFQFELVLNGGIALGGEHSTNLGGPKPTAAGLLNGWPVHFGPAKAQLSSTILLQNVPPGRELAVRD
jgi:hypothetical protein